MDKGAWENYCEYSGLNIWALNEGLADDEEIVTLPVSLAMQWGLIEEDAR